MQLNGDAHIEATAVLKGQLGSYEGLLKIEFYFQFDFHGTYGSEVTKIFPVLQNTLTANLVA